MSDEFWFLRYGGLSRGFPPANKPLWSREDLGLGVERAVDATLRLEMQMELAGLMYDVEHGEDRLGDPEE